MRAYKFRSAESIQFSFDILLHNRLWCSDWKKMNDPMEGLFDYSFERDEMIKRHIQMIIINKLEYKICALSQRYDSTLMWAHYGGSYQGLAIEIDIPDPISRFVDVPSQESIIVEVNYRQEFAFTQVSLHDDPDSIARKVLCSKQADWSYEKEVRILSKSEWYYLDRPPTRVIAGPRMDKALFDALKMICRKMSIPICKLKIDHDRLTIEEVRRGRVE